LSGTPATGSQGAYTLHFTVKDSSNTAANATLALTINPSAGPPFLFLGCLPLGTLTVGIAVSGGCSVFGGTSPYIFSISAGTLPAGLTLNSDTGMIGGTPTTAGPYSFTVEVTDSSSPRQTVTDAQGDTVSLPGSNSFVVAHTFDAPSFTTTIILINSGTVPAPYSLQFYDESGNVPASPVALQLGSLAGTIPAGNSTTIRTAGTGGYLGWAQVTAPASVAGSVIYSQKNQLPTIQEGTTTLAPNGSQHFFVPFDNTNGAISSLALTNPGTSPRA
jgi:large repetitive protein